MILVDSHLETFAMIIVTTVEQQIIMVSNGVLQILSQILFLQISFPIGLFVTDVPIQNVIHV